MKAGGCERPERRRRRWSPWLRCPPGRHYDRSAGSAARRPQRPERAHRGTTVEVAGRRDWKCRVESVARCVSTQFFRAASRGALRAFFSRAFGCLTPACKRMAGMNVHASPGGAPAC